MLALSRAFAAALLVPAAPALSGETLPVLAAPWLELEALTPAGDGSRRAAPLTPASPLPVA